jgi:hypothetical protein
MRSRTIAPARANPALRASLACAWISAVAGLLGPSCAGPDRARARDDSPGNSLAAPRSGDTEPIVRDASRRLVRGFRATGTVDGSALREVVGAGDPRAAWLLSDLLRLVPVGGWEETTLLAALAELTGEGPWPGGPGAGAWRRSADALIARDLAAPPQYRELKAELLLGVEPAWEPFFAAAESAIDWRLVTWGGVQIDERPFGAGGDCAGNCIPALDDPPTTAADDGDWYPDTRLVFGLEVGGQALALPKHLLEAHEVVNLRLGARRLGVAYCTLCASARAYFTDAVEPRFAPLVLRTSGLLARSNKILFDLGTRSALDTFTGRALSGPLRAARVELPSLTVVVSTWGAWKRAHPHTQILTADGGTGREVSLDPLRGRDDHGPIFPIGPVDGRLPSQAQVVGVELSNGGALAFSVDEARAALAAGRAVRARGVELVPDGSGWRARDERGAELVAAQAFWFAWSQFHPGTDLWRDPPR